MGQLIEFIQSVKGDPFEWGKHDCFTFASRCSLLQGGPDFAGEWLGSYSTAAGAIRAYKKAQAQFPQHGNLFGFLDSVLIPIQTLHPPIGSIVAKDNPEGRPFSASLGVVVGGSAGAFVGTDGLEAIPLQYTDKFWSIQ